MKVSETKLAGVLIIEPKLFGDSRGYFFESFQKERYKQVGVTAEFVQDNMSRSCKNTLRGLHYQLHYPQAKLVSVTRGQVYDVIIDIRQKSPTFGQWTSVLLDDQNHRQVYIPQGFAHGFCVLSEEADFHYKCTEYYYPEDEQGIIWNDPQLAIDWPLSGEPLLSQKDSKYPRLAEIINEANTLLF